MRHGYYSGERGVTVDLLAYAREIKFAIITRIEVHRKFRGNGYASDMMARVLEDADDEGVMLCLSVEADGTGLTNEQLRAWYERMDFEPLHIERAETDRVMVRFPQGHSSDSFDMSTFGDVFLGEET